MKVDVGVALGLLTQLGVLIALLTAAVVWLRKWLRKQVAEPLASVSSEVHLNQGQSMKDAVDRTERKLDILVARFEDHLALRHPGNGPQ